MGDDSIDGDVLVLGSIVNTIHGRIVDEDELPEGAVPLRTIGPIPTPWLFGVPATPDTGARYVLCSGYEGEIRADLGPARPAHWNILSGKRVKAVVPDGEEAAASGASSPRRRP